MPSWAALGTLNAAALERSHRDGDVGQAMSTPTNETRERSVALYWDFENLQAALMDVKYGDGSYAKADTRFKPQEPLIDVQALVELAASFGPVAINRAYCNWQFFGRYRDALLQSGVELIQPFPQEPQQRTGQTSSSAWTRSRTRPASRTSVR
jgi:hypothetical protein